MRDYMMALHQRFHKEPECREVRKELEAVHQELYQVLNRRGQEQLLKLADLENELQEEISLKSFLSGFKLALGIAVELAPPTPSTMTRSSGSVRPSGKGGVSNGQEAGRRRGKHP